MLLNEAVWPQLAMHVFELQSVPPFGEIRGLYAVLLGSTG